MCGAAHFPVARVNVSWGAALPVQRGPFERPAGPATDEQGATMATRIILLSDGTGNAASKVWRTNVWRLFESLDLTQSDQVAFYDDGVGTSSFKPMAILGGAFGWGLKRNVIDLYKFVCRNYRSDEDDIFGFGFSRGAFTIRIVAGLIIDQGLVPYTSEAELDRRARDAYRAFRRENFHTVWRIEKPFQLVRDLLIPSTYDKAQNRRIGRIRFLGLWDTVAAYGLPVDEMTRGVSEWIWPLELPERRLCDQVERACHALSLDDERTTFHPVLWNERHESRAAPDADGISRTGNERISQVWFAGAHANVGGGYPDDALAHIPLCWIMAEARDCGLRFKTSPPADSDAMAQRQSARDKDGRLYDPRRGIGGYYRYGPRKISDLCHMRFSKNPDDEVEISVPKIHESALKRVREGARVYAPIGLPLQYAVVTDDRRILPPEQNHYEPPVRAQARAKAQELVWNLVWCRRVVYFATVAASLQLLLYPLFRPLPRADELSTMLRPVSDLVRLVGAFVPDALDVWLDTYAADPSQFLIAAGAVVALILLGSAIGAKITDEMRSVWKSESPVPRSGWFHDRVYRLRTNAAYQWTIWFIKRHLAPFLFAAAFLYLGLAFASHLIFNFEDAAGLICRGTDANNLKRLEPGEESGPVKFSIANICTASGINLEHGGIYLLTVKQDGPWHDGSIATGTRGFYSVDVNLKAPAAISLTWPLKRDYLRPWFRVIARVGSTGSYETFLDPAPPPAPEGILQQSLRPERSGELFLYVNDAVLALPWLQDIFYRNNSGTATLTVKRL